ncbi:hypothetical protein THRCLA_07023 [Thraustotheca clavata]|uniref:TLDc domain-containing protein n=1 Tax=Thraustotheca clavata TaxID=74557 RepID=A0A1V9ZH42_9STRA|nr:hypothetical protein THRCLA_07023 [Thraustotheca clavata]
MGNKGSSRHSYSASEIEALKGPFSDSEFDCLEALADATCSNREAFEEHFSLSVPQDKEDMPVLVNFGASLYTAFLHITDEPVTTELTMPHLAKAAALCIRSSSSSILRCLWAVFDPTLEQDLNDNQLHQLFTAVLLMADVEKDTEKKINDYVNTANSMVASFQLSATEVTLLHLTTWASRTFPLMHTIFSTWMSKKCFKSMPSTRTSYSTPELSHASDILSRGEAIVLSGQSAQLQNQWDRLYTSTQDGLSFNRLCYHLLGYSGPTLIVCTATDGATFGAYCDTPWRDQSKFFGGPGCFLYRLRPNLLVCPSSGQSGTNYMYFNTKGVALPRGLGLGGTTSKCRLFFDEDLDDCYTALKCNTFEQGSITLRASFQIQTLEIWGCGGEESKMAQKGYRAETAELINKARKVDKSQFVNNGFDREMFLGKTFGHGTDAARIADDEH